MNQHPGVLVFTGLAVFTWTVAAALNPPEEVRQPDRVPALEQKIENLERQHEVLKEWADERLVPWTKRVAHLQERLAEEVGITPPGIPAPSISPLPPVPVPSPPAVSPVSSPSPSCVFIPIANVCLGDPSHAPNPGDP